MKHYFATDGNYGDANKIAIVDTSFFSEKDWGKIEEAQDSRRSEIAKNISKKYKKKNEKKKLTH